MTKLTFWILMYNPTASQWSIQHMVLINIALLLKGVFVELRFQCAVNKLHQKLIEFRNSTHAH